MISIHFQAKPFNITVFQVYVPNINTEEAEVDWFYEDILDLLELTWERDFLFIKSRKSRDTKSNKQVWPWSTKWNRAKTDRVLPRDHGGHSKQSFPATQEMSLHMDITRCLIPKSDWLYSFQPKMEKLYTVSKNKTGSWLWLGSWTPYCKIQDLNWRKAGKTTRPLRSGLNQIPYDYTVKVTKRFKGLDLIYRVPEELWM